MEQWNNINPFWDMVVGHVWLAMKILMGALLFYAVLNRSKPSSREGEDQKEGD